MSETQTVLPDKPLDDDEIMLTDAEREALKEDEADADEGEGEEGAGEAKPEAGAEAPAAPSRDDGTPPDAEPATGPLIPAGDTEAAKARLTAIAGERDALAERFDDGDLTAKEYSAALKALEDEAREMDWTLRKAALSAEVQEQQVKLAWQKDCTDFLTQHPYIKANETRFNSFDLVVRQITGDPANDNLTGPQKLAKAHEQWRNDLGIGKPAAPPPTKPPRNLPPSMHNIPASAVESTDDGRFGALDRLADTDPIAYEKRFAALSEAEQNAYLSIR